MLRTLDDYIGELKGKEPEDSVRASDLCVASDTTRDGHVALGTVGVLLDRVTSADQVGVTVGCGEETCQTEVSPETKKKTI